MSERVLPPRETWRPRVFVRSDTFYVIDLPQDEDLALHAELNPGTLQILDEYGDVLWRQQ